MFASNEFKSKPKQEYTLVSDIVDNEDEIYGKAKPHEHEQPRLLRGHPRWCPTNNPNDINCLYFIVPIPRRHMVKQQYNWMNERNSLNSTEDKLRLQQELLYSGSMIDCLKLKYLKRKHDTIKIISQRYGIDEPYNTQNYCKNHLFNENQFRLRPPKYFVNNEIPTKRYQDLKYYSNIGLTQMEYEAINYQNIKWGTSYKLFKLRTMLKKYLVEKDILKQQDVVTV